MECNQSASVAVSVRRFMSNGDGGRDICQKEGPEEKNEKNHKNRRK